MKINCGTHENWIIHCIHACLSLWHTWELDYTLHIYMHACHRTINCYGIWQLARQIWTIKPCSFASIKMINTICCIINICFCNINASSLFLQIIQLQCALQHIHTLYIQKEHKAAHSSCFFFSSSSFFFFFFFLFFFFFFFLLLLPFVSGGHFKQLVSKTEQKHVIIHLSVNLKHSTPKHTLETELHVQT